LKEAIDAHSNLRFTFHIVAQLPLGTEWLIDAFECRPQALRSRDALSEVFSRVVREMDLHPEGDPHWHIFPGEGGITGMLLLSESHLACHTFPERGFAAFNLYCCRPRAEWPWEERLREMLDAQRISVRMCLRGLP
jgi:S-adenosylmethionine decarboxylase